MSSAKDILSAWVDAHQDAILTGTQGVLRIPSVKEEETVGVCCPFGEPIADALTYTLTLCKGLGMATENFDGYAGHAEFGTGEEIVAMLGHLDVVPVGKAWTKDPWGAEISDGWIWGRGTSDDKGPTYAALFGAKAVLDAVSAGILPPLSRRIRLIFGCDEESGWECMAHYFGAAGQPKPTFAFTPDACFPLIYAEKGSFNLTAVKEVATGGTPLRVASFESGLRSNMVPDEATAVLEGHELLLEAVAHVLSEGEGITTSLTDGKLVVTATGRSAHGSTPEVGDNAALKLCRTLTNNTSILDDMTSEDDIWMSDLIEFGTTEGGGIGIAGRDDITGPLTNNLGIVNLHDDEVLATFNVRYPATWDGETLLATATNVLGKKGWRVVEQRHTPPLYVPQDAEPVKTLLAIYREHTGDMSEPMTIGGRTYATSVAPVGVAFGPSREGDPDVAHQADEKLSVERFFECVRIYAHALYELAK